MHTPWRSAYSVSTYIHLVLIHRCVLIALDDKHLTNVPGTGLLSDLGIVHGAQMTITEATHLKHGTGRDAHIILIPQPSDDPRDPYAVFLVSVCRTCNSLQLQAKLASLEKGGFVLDPVSQVLVSCSPLTMMPLFYRAFAASLDGALSPLASAGYVLLSQQFRVSVDEVTSSFGAILLGLGCFMSVSICLLASLVSLRLCL